MNEHDPRFRLLQRSWGHRIKVGDELRVFGFGTVKITGIEVRDGRPVGSFQIGNQIRYLLLDVGIVKIKQSACELLFG